MHLRYRILKSHTAFSCSWLFPGYRNFYRNLCRNSMLSAVLSNAAVMHLFPEPGSLVHHLTISRLKPAHCYAALIMPSASATLGMPHKVLQILHVLQYSCQIYAAVTWLFHSSAAHILRPCRFLLLTSSWSMSFLILHIHRSSIKEVQKM